MAPYSCTAVACPLPHKRYEARIKRPPECRFGDRCTIVRVADPAPETVVAPESPVAASVPPDGEGPVVASEVPMIAPIPPPVEDDALPAVLRLFPERSAPVRRALAVTLHARETIFDIPLPSVLGRKGSVAAAAFADDTTVSREHVELRASASAVVVRNIAVSGNTVHVDDRSIPLDASLRLGPGRYTLRFGSRFVCALVVSVA